MSTVKIFYHGNCFDGAVSAALFSEMVILGVDPTAEFTYRPLANKPGAFDAESFDGDINAIVDFRYDRRADWWFDHHAKGVFADAVEEADFLADGNNRKFYEPDFKSCARLIANVAKSRFGIHEPGFETLAAWADRIDGAQFATAEDAVSLDSPAAQLTAVLESVKNPNLHELIIRLLRSHGLADTANDPHIRQAFQPLKERHREIENIVRDYGEMNGDIMVLDVVRADIEGMNKFVPYALFPKARYSVILSTKLSTKGDMLKIAVGHNPFGAKRTHDIGAICADYNGGGHPGVGAAWYGLSQVEEAQTAANEIIRTLQS